jgi:hypothetical protein
MAQELTLLPAGWIPDPNPHSAAPPGAATVADNVVIERRGIVRPRPGFPEKAAFAGTVGAVGTYIFTFENDDYLWETIGLVYDCEFLVRVSDGATVHKDASVDTAGPTVYYPVKSTVGASHSAQTSSNLYITTSDGVRRIETTTGAAGARALLTGVPQGLTPNVQIDTPLWVGSRWFKADSQVAYRIVFRKTVRGIPLYGAPSGYTILTNPAAGADGGVQVDIPIPLSVQGASGGLNIVAGDRVLVYRTTSTDADDTPPGDEMQLVADQELTAADLTAALVGTPVTIYDRVKNENLGAFLYTNSTIDGILQGNNRPPIAGEVIDYASSLYFGNCQVYAQQGIDIVKPINMVTVTEANVIINVGTPYLNIAGTPDASRIGMFLGAGQSGGAGPWAGDPLGGTVFFPGTTQIIGVDVPGPGGRYLLSQDALASWGGAGNNMELHSYMAACSQGQMNGTYVLVPYFSDIYFSASLANGASIPNRMFTVDTTSAAKTAQNLAMTAGQNGERYFNVYQSGGDDKIASLLWEERVPKYAGPIDATQCELFAYPADSYAVSPTVVIPEPFALGSGYIFQTNVNQNRVYYSKQSQPEAVPKTNYFDVGSSSFPIQRMIRTRESLFILKQDGVFRLTATSPFDQRLDLVDPTYSLVHPDAACMFDNRIFAWTNQGVVLISDRGISPISANIIQSELDAVQNTLVTIAPQGKPFAFADESRDLAYLGVPATGLALAACTEMFVFCGRTSTWSRYTFSDRYLRDGVRPFKGSWSYLAGSTTAPQSKVYGQNSSPYDASFAITVTVAVGTEITIAAGSGWTPVVGDVIQVGAAVVIVTAVTSAVQFTVHDTGIVAAAGTAYVGFLSELEFIVKEAQNPGRLKHWRYVVPVFGSLKGIVTFDATFKTNQDVTSATLNASVPYTATANPRTVRLTPTRQHSRAAELYVRFGFRTALAEWTLQGMSLTYNAGSSRVQR